MLNFEISEKKRHYQTIGKTSFSVLQYSKVTNIYKFLMCDIKNQKRGVQIPNIEM